MKAEEAALERAIAFATDAHSGQVDKLGEPYIAHCRWVMDGVPDSDKRVAILHDVVEDTDYSLGAVAYYCRLSPTEVLALDLLTRRPGDSYDEFIGRCAAPPKGYEEAAPIVRRVKMRDVRHHLKRWRPEIGMDLKRRYERALARLTTEETT
jgi:hypothetical protein